MFMDGGTARENGMKKKASQSKVDRICTVQRRVYPTWFDRLSEADQNLCLEVRQEVVKKGLPIQPVARNPIAELNLDCARTSVCDWIRRGRTE